MIISDFFECWSHTTVCTINPILLLANLKVAVVPC